MKGVDKSQAKAELNKLVALACKAEATYRDELSYRPKLSSASQDLRSGGGKTSPHVQAKPCNKRKAGQAM